MSEPLTQQPLRIDVFPPRKTADLYEFHCDVAGERLGFRPMARRLRAWLRHGGPIAARRLHFGFRAHGYRIAHAEVWDTIFPLLYLFRNGGPLFRSGHDSAVVRFRYPVLEPALGVFVDRAAAMGLTVRVEADTHQRRASIPGRGRVLAFGGGKESRLLFGLLRETGRSPFLTMGGAARRPGDLEVTHLTEPIRGSLAEYVMPGFMAGAAEFYFGGSLGEAARQQPWTQYYDMGSPEGQAQLTRLLRDVGVDLAVRGPLMVLPSNQIQRLLAARYPDLAARQASTPEGIATEKNLHVSLAKLHHGLPIEPQCTPNLFARLLRRFVDQKRQAPDDYGFHRYREPFHREMLAILHAQRRHVLVAPVAGAVQESWAGRWIEGIHTYVDPRVDPAMLSIFRLYAPEYEPSPGEYRVDHSGR